MPGQLKKTGVISYQGSTVVYELVPPAPGMADDATAYAIQNVTIDGVAVNIDEAPGLAICICILDDVRKQIEKHAEFRGIQSMCDDNGH